MKTHRPRGARFGAPLLIAAVLAAPGLLTAPAAAAAGEAGTGPVVRLFPTTVLEDIRETGQVAEDMENSLADVIRRLDLQQTLYAESLCQGADGDAGCERIARQLGATYLEMLDLMSARLPEMEASVGRTRSSLEKRLREEIGLRTTPTSLQETLLGESRGAPPGADEGPALRGRSGVRLSDRFQQYYELVATRRGGTSSSSLAVIASDIYLDMEDAEYLIAATRQEIARASLMEQLNQSFGLITPQMAEVVAGVKEILFGETGGEGAIASPPYVIGETEFVSPLAF
jgi:hypothetical protein